MIVELKYAGVPRWGLVAVHYWFVTNENGIRDRWEVWQEPYVRAPCIGHLYKNLMRPDSCVGGSPTRLAHVWLDDSAERIAEAIFESWSEYPYRQRYRTLGPNSNTYVAWILNKANVQHRLSWRAVGKNFVFPA